MVPAARRPARQSKSTLIDAPRQTKSKPPLARQLRHDNHGAAATLAFSSRLSLASHPDRRATLWRDNEVSVGSLYIRQRLQVARWRGRQSNANRTGAARCSSLVGANTASEMGTALHSPPPAYKGHSSPPNDIKIEDRNTGTRLACPTRNWASRDDRRRTRPRAELS